MTRILAFVLSLFLLCPLIPVSTAAVAAPVVTLVSEGHSSVLTDDVLPAAAAPAGKVFAGWRAEGIFLPAGGAYTGSEDITLTAVFVGMTTRPDPTVRTQVKTGIRFLTDIDKADFAALQSCAAVTYGTLFAPADYVQAAGALTPAALTAAGKTWLETVSGAFYGETDTVATVAGSLVDILPQNRYRGFQGAGFLKIAYTDGTTGLAVAAPSAAVRMYDLALTAYADRTDIADVIHTNATANGFSPYNAAQLTYFGTVLDGVVNMKYLRLNGEIVTLDFYGYREIAPYGVEYDPILCQIVFQVKEGNAYRFHNSEHLLAVIIKDKSTGIYKEAKKNVDYTVTADGKTLCIAYQLGDFSGMH